MSEKERSPVAHWLEGLPDAPAAIRSNGAVTTRAGFAREVRAAARALRDLPSGSRVAIDADAPHAFAVLLAAVLWTGSVPVLFAGRGGQYERLLDDYDAVLTTERGKPFPKPALCATIDEGSEEAAAAATPGALELRAPEAQRPVILFTSGSSGTPKRIEKTVGLMSREAEITQRLFGDLLHGSVLAATVDPRHLYGLTFAVWMAKRAGVPVADARTVYQEQLLGFDRPVALVTTPTFMRMIDADLPRPRIAFCLTAAGVLDEEALSRMHAWTAGAVHEIYGSTETGVVASRRHEAGAINPDWTLIEEAGLEEDADGWCLTSPLLPRGTMRLDDRLAMTSEHVFRLLGRLDRIVKIGEMRLSLTEVERVVRDVLELDIRAIPVAQPGRTVIGAVVCERTAPGWRGRCPNRIETTAALAGRLDPLARPRLWRHVPEWPTDAQGKVVVPMLAELFECGADHTDESKDNHHD